MDRISSKKLRCLVIDDSTHNRSAIVRILQSHPDVEVVGTAEDGEQGLKEAARLEPDLITLDVEMPRMDGFTFLRLLMVQRPTPVLMISSHSRKQEVFQALELGALDFVAKPTRFLAAEEGELRDAILTKIDAIRHLQVRPFARAAATRPSAPRSGGVMRVEVPKIQPRHLAEQVVCVGASTGGPPALQAMLRPLVTGTRTALLVGQHMPEKFTRAFAERLDRHTAFRVVEAEEGMPVEADTAYIAPGGSHLEVEIEGARRVLKLRPVTSDDHYVPSIDRLFATAARCYGKNVLAAVLTGMGSDGKQGVREVRAHGGRNLAESEESAIVFGMPKEAIETGCIDEIATLEGIVGKVSAHVRASIITPSA